MNEEVRAELARVAGELRGVRRELLRERALTEQVVARGTKKVSRTRSATARRHDQLIAMRARIEWPTAPGGGQLELYRRALGLPSPAWLPIGFFVVYLIVCLLEERPAVQEPAQEASTWLAPAPWPPPARATSPYFARAAGAAPVSPMGLLTAAERARLHMKSGPSWTGR